MPYKRPRALPDNSILDQVLAASTDYHFIFDSEHRFIYANQGLLNIYKITLEELVGKTFEDIGVEPHLVDLHREQLRGAFKGRVVHGQNEYITPDGFSGYFEYSFSPIFDETGRVQAVAGFGREVSSRRNAERAILENERMNLRNLFKQTPEMVCYLKGPEHTFEFVNEAHIRALGFDATGMRVREAQPQSIQMHETLDNVYRTGLTAEMHEIPITLTDRVRYFNLTYVARYNEKGDINGVMILGAEVTEQVLQRTSLELVASLIQTMPAPFFAMNSKWEVVYWNPAAAEVIGIPKEEVLGKIAWDIFPGLEESDFGRTYKMVRSDKVARSFEAYFEPYKKWYQALPFPFEEGVAVVFMDTTARKNIEEELERSKARYQLLFDHSPLPKWIIDTETYKFLDVNLAAVKHYGYSKEEFLSMGAADIRPKEDVPVFLDAMKKDFDGTHNYERRRRHVKKDGSVIEVELTALDIVLDGQKRRIGAVVDVTDRVASEIRQNELLKSLNAAKEEAEKANELKSSFLANMSHEIRTPLGAMIGFADLLRDHGLSEEERTNYIEILIRNGEQLAAIINDILDLSKVEAGHMTLDFSPADPNAIVMDVVALLRVKAREKNLSLSVRTENSAPESIVTDELRTRQILMNIIGNAIKFTPSGSIDVRIYGGQDASHKNMIYFEVSDTGVGIPESQIEGIFNVFVQADSALTRKFGGTGLGLALSRRLARALGGDVVVTESREGKGSKFLISIGTTQQKDTNVSKRVDSERVVAPVDSSLLKDVRILVADDFAENRQIISTYITKYGAIVDFADNGLAAYRKALDGHFDIVLMDIQMPEMDGYTATQKLRDAGFTKPVIALTAHAMSEVRMKCLNVGCTDYLAKPIRRDELIATLVRYIKPHSDSSIILN